MNLKKIFLIFMLIIAFSLAVGSVNAIKVYNQDSKSIGPYSDGFKKVSTSGYEYHSGKLHKNMKSNYKYKPYCYNGPNKKCKYYGCTDIGYWWVEGTVGEIKKVKYANIKVNGKFYKKKVKLYNDERFEGTGKFPKYHPTNDLKGNLKGKTITLSVHDKNGKLLASKSFKIKKITRYYYIGA